MSEQGRFEGARRSDLYIEREASGPPSTAELPHHEGTVRELHPAAIVEPDPAPVAPPSRRQRAAAPVLAEPAPVALVSDEPAREGFRAFLNSLGFRLAPGPAELERRRASAEAETQLERCRALIRQASWTRAVRVLVANKKGTAGKTPTCITLGGTLAAIRGGSVAITEFSDDRGQLAWRSEGEPMLGIGELARNIDSVTTQAQLRGYAVTQTSFASVIGSTAKWREPLTREDVLKVSSVVGEHFTIQVMDTGNQYSSGPFSAAVELADVLVIPTMNAWDSVSDAIELLNFLEDQGGAAAQLAAEAVVVRLNDSRPEHHDMKESILAAGVPESRFFDVPFDPHIAERAAITLGKLAPATQDALTTVAAKVIEQINRRVAALEAAR
ncbi:hypothetical protein SPF06_19700 [Sinomonas sp. JGH33]|uniref:ATPase n=1 Tax=Sinomonas terricola TaxID=3110330 RepID=A0ABU5TBI3_9MICC|nr:hypothetical protein [Sinomonas sp. JGH33]MEA5456953.1 hypothetical protein [Sinomonas sp. JGH33]